MSPFLAELLGTTILIVLGNGVVANVVLHRTKGHGAERGLGVPTAVAGFALPLAVATFKFSGPAAILVGVLFTGRLYDISFGPLALAQATLMALVLSFAVPGVPGGWLLIAAPIFAAMGVPVQAIGMLLAVDAIPDMFRTPVNVTADLAVTAILGRETSTE